MEKHYAIIVCGFRVERVIQARDKAIELFHASDAEVTRLTKRGNGGISSFMVAPDGLTTGAASRYGQSEAARQQFLAWLGEQSGTLDYTPVEIPMQRSHAGMPMRKQPYHEMRSANISTLDSLKVILDRLFDPDPPVDVEQMLDLDLAEELELDSPDDYIDILDEIEATLPVKFNSGHSPLEFATLRDLLHLVNTAYARQSTEAHLRRRPQSKRPKRGPTRLYSKGRRHKRR